MNSKSLPHGQARQHLNINEQCLASPISVQHQTYFNCFSKMSVTFGSVGDIISVCLIVKDLVDALDKSRGSSAEYQAVIRELWSLDRALLQVAMLSKTCEDCIELHALRVTAV